MGKKKGTEAQVGHVFMTLEHVRKWKALFFSLISVVALPCPGSSRVMKLEQVGKHISIRGRGEKEKKKQKGQIPFLLSPIRICK